MGGEDGKAAPRSLLLLRPSLCFSFSSTYEHTHTHTHTRSCVCARVCSSTRKLFEGEEDLEHATALPGEGRRREGRTNRADNDAAAKAIQWRKAKRLGNFQGQGNGRILSPLLLLLLLLWKWKECTHMQFVCIWQCSSPTSLCVIAVHSLSLGRCCSRVVVDVRKGGRRARDGLFGGLHTHTAEEDGAHTYSQAGIGH